MAAARIDVSGVRPLMRVLEQLPAKLQARVVKPALRRAARPIIRAARSNLVANRSVETGGLRKSIGVKLKQYKARGVTVAIIGARRGVTKTGGEPANYAHLVELGHRNARNGQEIPAKPFLRPALESTKSASVNEFRARLGRQIEKEAAKLAAKGVK